MTEFCRVCLGLRQNTGRFCYGEQAKDQGKGREQACERNEGLRYSSRAAQQGCGDSERNFLGTDSCINTYPWRAAETCTTEHTEWKKITHSRAYTSYFVCFFFNIYIISRKKRKKKKNIRYDQSSFTGRTGFQRERGNKVFRSFFFFFFTASKDRPRLPRQLKSV